jgi:hypothetical protein
MTLIEAKNLYIEAGGPDDHGASEWEDIHKEIQALVEAKSDRAAGKTILWWDCWDAKYTATAFARRVRNSYANEKLCHGVAERKQ